MKKVLIIIGIVVSLSVGWLATVQAIQQSKDNSQMEKYVAFANKQAELGAYGAAIDYMKKAVNEEKTYDNVRLLADYYHANEDIDSYIEMLEELINMEPSVRLYNELQELYYNIGDYSSCMDTIMEAYNEGYSDEHMLDVYYECKYRYVLVGGTYDNIHNYYNGCAVVEAGEEYYMLNSKVASTCGKKAYEYLSGYSESKIAVTREGHSYYMDIDGNKYIDTEKDYEMAYSYQCGLAVVVRDGKYYYVNSTFRELYGPFDYASSYAENVAAVCVNGKWRLIDIYGEFINEEEYEDIIIDEENQCSVKGVIFAKKNNQYIMLNTKGEAITEQQFEDARVFFTDNVTAVKYNGKWGFIYTDGTVCIEPQYEDAKAFGNGIAAVCIDGKWGFINTKQRIVIEPVFEDAKCCGQNNLVPVKIDGYWRVLKITK